MLATRIFGHCERRRKRVLTASPCVVRLYVDGLDLAILENQSVTLGTAVAKDSHTIKVQL